MKIQSAHFGEVEISDQKILHFPEGLPGLEDEQRFALLTVGDGQPINWLQSLDHEEIALPVLDPFVVNPSYAFDVRQEDIDFLEISEMKDVYILSVLVIPSNVDDMTINLSAPIIINVVNNRGRQICLDDKQYRVRTPVAQLLRQATESGEEKHASADQETE